MDAMSLAGECGVISVECHAVGKGDAGNIRVDGGNVSIIDALGDSLTVLMRSFWEGENACCFDNVGLVG
jgi:hypothetical protein